MLLVTSTLSTFAALNDNVILRHIIKVGSITAVSDIVFNAQILVKGRMPNFYGSHCQFKVGTYCKIVIKLFFKADIYFKADLYK